MVCRSFHTDDLYLFLLCSNLGQEKQLLVFDFGDFKIGRHLKVTVCDSTFKSILEPTSPYQRTNTLKQCRLNFEERNRGDGWVVSGRRPARWTDFSFGEFSYEFFIICILHIIKRLVWTKDLSFLAFKEMEYSVAQSASWIPYPCWPWRSLFGKRGSGGASSDTRGGI